jgi:prepilin-type N-terminal cleavage/methylation domain-containing protein
MTATKSLRRRVISRSRHGMTLIEVMLAIVILSGAMLGLANFVRKFQHTTSDTSQQAMASNLATLRLEEVKGYRVYSTLIATYNGVSETFVGDPVYTRCNSCPTTTNDYITVTVSVTGNNLPVTMKKTTIIAAF